MDPFKDCFGDIVDLDDPNTYQDDDYKGTVLELMARIEEKIGYSLFVLQYHHRDWDLSDKTKQPYRVDKLCKEFAEESRIRACDDIPENRLWFQKFMFKFGDEVENIC